MHLKTSIAAASALALFASGVHARTIIDHTDVDILFDHDTMSGEWSMSLLDTFTEVEYDSADTYLRMNENSMRTRPAGAAFDFIGPEETEIWYLPEADPGAPYDSLFGAHRVTVDAGVFLDNEAELTFPSMVTPNGGHAHLWIEDAFGNPTLLFSSDPAAGAPNALTFQDLSDSDHIHMNWAFTAGGVYEADMRVDAELEAGGATFVEENVQFQVIPEASTYALILGGAMMGLVWIRRRFGRLLRG